MTIICAHRGASGHAPENTLAALLLAVDQGAAMAEIDVRLSADGTAVLLHDETVDRTTNGRGEVAALPMDQLRRLDAGSWFGGEWAGEKLPSLAEVLDAVGGRLKLNIELKGAAGAELEQEVVRLVRAAGLNDRCLLTSFDHGRIDRLAAGEAGLELGYIVGHAGWRPELLSARVPVLSLEHTLVTADLAGACRAAGKQVHVWTVNRETDLRRVLDLAVDVVITNYPERSRKMGQ